MTRDTTLLFLHLLLADLPQAIETGDQLIRLINRTYGKLAGHGDPKNEVTPDDITRLLSEIHRHHASIREMD